MEFKDAFPLLRDMGLFGFFVWGVQKIITNSSERKFADYKSLIDLQMLSYKTEYDKQIETYRSELNFLNSRLSSLHSERMKIIKELNEKLINLNSAMLRLVSIRPVHEDPEKDKEIQTQIYTDAHTTYAEYNNFILFNKIYLDKSLAAKLENIRKEFFSAHWNYFEPKRLQSMGLTRGEAYKEAGNKVQEASKKISNEISGLLEEVEDDFRKLLGVSN